MRKNKQGDATLLQHKNAVIYGGGGEITAR
jgi:hypothetical protein